jgi:hypothetical protein
MGNSTAEFLNVLTKSASGIASAQYGRHHECGNQQGDSFHSDLPLYTRHTLYRRCVGVITQPVSVATSSVSVCLLPHGRSPRLLDRVSAGRTLRGAVQYACRFAAT